MKNYLFFIFIILCSINTNGQVLTSKALRMQNTIYIVLDVNVDEFYTFRKIDKYYNGTKIDDSKCDNIICIKYKGEYFKRNYDKDIDIRWFGCNEVRIDNQVIINNILEKYGTTYITAGVLEISGTINVAEKASVRGIGIESFIKLVSKGPTDGLSIFRQAALKNFKLDCTETELNLNAAIIVNTWNNVESKAGELTIGDVVLVGNYPKLQGVGLKLKIKPTTDRYALIAFVKFRNIDIYGFRDGVFCDLEYGGGKNISFLNANIFSNIILYYCLRPVRLINTAKATDMISSKATISNNIFSNVIIQHAVGDYPVFYIDGGTAHDINVQIIDWKGLYLQETPKYTSNKLDALPVIYGKIKNNLILTF